METLCHSARVTILLTALFISCNGAEKQEKIVNTASGNTTEPRLGLVATQLGLSPVPGYASGGDGDAGPAIDIPPQDYLPTGGAPAPPPDPEPVASGYSIQTDGGIQGGNLISPSQCQCVPVEQCPSLNLAGGGGSYGGPGGNLGGGPGGNVGGGLGGGAYPVGDGDDSYGGQQGGNIPGAGGNYGGQGGQQGGNYPIGGGGGGAGGNYGGQGGQQGGNLPVIGPGDGNYGGQQGGNLPVIGGGGGSGGSYGGQQGGNLPVIGGGGGSYGGDGQHGGNLPVDPNGYGDKNAGSAPNTDGSGLLDLRIVNRPSRPGGVQCLNGQVFCCDIGKPNPGPGFVGKPNYPGPGGSGGYVTCGSRNFIDVPGKQLGYADAKFGAYPWMAVILGEGNKYVGAGALISPYYVLTAAHKIRGWQPGAAMKVRLGEWNAKEDDEPYKNVEVGIDNVLIHPGFNAQNLQNDIALVRLSEAVDIKSHPHIKTVCLPQKGYQYTGQRCWVAGFGKDAFGNGKHSYIMKEVDLPILDSNDCENRLRTTRLGKYFQLNRYSFLCAGGEEGKDACTGDGGSPLVCDNGNGGFQAVGLVAWGIGCADYGIPGVYVNVPNYVEWIEQEIYRY